MDLLVLACVSAKSTGFVLFLFFHEITYMKYLPTFCRRSTGSASGSFIKQQERTK